MKVAQYTSLHMYIIYELKDAVHDCNSGDINNNDAGVMALDEGYAFYAGSLLGGVEFKYPQTSGKSMYTLADKRCSNFGKCTQEGGSIVNIKVMKAFNDAQTALKAGKCDEADTHVDEITRLMNIPLMQGL